MRYQRCPVGRVQDPVAEYGKIIRRVGVAGDHPLQLARHILDAQGCVQSGLLHHFPGVLAAARYFSDQKEAFLPDALGEFPDHITERPQRLRPHVLGGVDAESIEIGVSDPEAVDEAKAGESRRRLAILPGPLHPNIEGLQIEHVSLGILRVVIPIRDMPLAKEQVRALELPGPNGAVRPSRLQLGAVRRVKRQRRPAVTVVEALDGVGLAVPAGSLYHWPEAGSCVGWRSAS